MMNFTRMECCKSNYIMAEMRNVLFDVEGSRQELMIVLKALSSHRAEYNGFPIQYGQILIVSINYPLLLPQSSLPR